MKPHPVHGLLTLSVASIIAVAGSASAQSLSLAEATIADLGAAFDAGSLTSERLVTLYLARIEAYDDDGPGLNAFLTLNPRALETARALDRERRATGPRSLLHGIPVVLKDNVDTHDMPTTAGSLLLKGSIPPDDAFIVRKLREAGAIILGKANMSEFASGVTLSSIDGPMRNPHDLTRTPSGSSGGTGVASEGRYEADYTRVLDDGVLQGARIGVARDFLGYDTEVDWIIGAALDAMRAAGATVVDVRYPDRLPVGISFLGRMFSEARLLALGYAFEQKTRVRRDPAHTPALPGETIPRY